jgi:hypothetical protein
MVPLKVVPGWFLFFVYVFTKESKVFPCLQEKIFVITFTHLVVLRSSLCITPISKVCMRWHLQ